MTVSTRAHKAAKRYIYAWGGGRAEGNGSMKELLGGKGAGLAEMTLAGLPTPPGFTITTEACNDYFAAGETLPAGLWDDVLEAVKEVERETGKGFGDPANPLLVSVRSGAKFSSPRSPSLTYPTRSALRATTTLQSVAGAAPPGHAARGRHRYGQRW